MPRLSQWTRDGKRLVTGNDKGELTLWLGDSFSFDSIFVAHSMPGATCQVRAVTSNRSGDILVSGDDRGQLKYWTASFVAHNHIDQFSQSVSSIDFSAGDRTFVVGRGDGAMRLWDFLGSRVLAEYSGHDSNVKRVRWHPHSTLWVSASDKKVRLWDPRVPANSACVGILQTGMRPMTDVSWSANGWHLATTGEDSMVTVFDARVLKPVWQVNVSDYKHATTVAWHPYQERVLATGHFGGAISYFTVGEDTPAARVELAHDECLTGLEWNPAGHALASSSMDAFAKIWVRTRPGDTKQYTYSGTSRTRRMGRSADGGSQFSGRDDRRGGFRGGHRGGHRGGFRGGHR